MSIVKTHDLNCIVCGSDQYQLLFKEAKERGYGIEGSFTYVRCKKCGLVYMNPQIDPEELARFYPQTYAPHRITKSQPEKEAKLTQHHAKLTTLTKNFLFSYHKSNQVSSFVLSPLNKEREILETGYDTNLQMNSEFLGSYPHNRFIKNQPGENIKSVPGRAKQLTRLIKNFLFDYYKSNQVPSFILESLNKESKILDVGCGNATFLNDIRNKVGCHVYGVDISDSAVKAAKENYALDVIKGTPEEGLPFPQYHFNLITAWWSLVHLTKPHKALQEFSRLLKEDGYGVIGVPNFNSFNARFFRDRWMHLDAPRHLCIHTPSTIQKMLEQHGFSVKKIIYDENPSGLFGSLQRYYYGTNAVPEKVKIPPFLQKIFLIFVRLTALFKVSDLLIVCVQKQSKKTS